MSDIYAKKVVGMTDLREPNKVLELANGEPVGVMNRNMLAGYFVPADAVNRLGLEEVDHDVAMAAYKAIKPSLEPGLEFLKDN